MINEEISNFIIKNFEYCQKELKLKRNGKVVFGYNHSKGYKVISIMNKMIYVHRIILFLVNGRWPNVVDHIDGNKANNSHFNLRDCTIRENQNNLKCHRDGKLVGAIKEKNKWKSNIKIKNKTIHLGFFNSEKDASLAYLKARREI